MAALKNFRHEMFCQAYKFSPNPFIKHNATKSYRLVYPRASYKTAMANGPLLRAKCQGRLDEIYEEHRKLQGGYQPIDYRRGVVKKYKPYAKSNNKKLNQASPGSIGQSQTQNKAAETRPIVIHDNLQILEERIKNQERNSIFDDFDRLAQ